MKDFNQIITSKKISFVLTAIFVVVLLALAIWAIHPFETAEHFARCDGSFSVWRRNPSISSFRYETRDGTTVLETNLRYKEVKDFLDEHSCLILGGG